ncbi:alpha-amylase family glycosyl hydrolase [Actinoplanes sp. Pm04-4]|uniref:Alpha-amylase n=1 Tax=Paractinoplanes pyxinae TaxID=2997416 RepID=A0ABT4AV04_9ACTN|nr:alpha-amylase family glycosyl hydrolase [Actinoplanes pyxinae]MCY1138079.1 alpha-amylase family glycosyl hydrolase [Actinoplanes pyxinae]
MRKHLAVILAAVLAGGVISAPAAASGGGLPGRHSLRAPVTDENFYFVMADRFDNGSTANDQGGLGADPLVSGFDPTKKGFYNGGDLAGLLRRIDYIKGLGTTSIWLTPSFKNKAVQLEDGPSAGYHGYWITDFTQIDPHLGTNAELKTLIDAAHQRGMKVYFDIITNHTADVIGYESGARQPYVSKDVSPYKTAAGKPFDDRDYAGKPTFPPLDPATSFPYKPVLDPAEKNLKVPAWLNDTTLYHNRGDTTFVGENSLYGDFFGLDDLFTEHPRVVNGMIDVYEKWIADFGVDGFRIDTMKHVNDEFWQKFGPQVLSFARKHGKPEFFMFGEVFDTSKSFTSQFTTRNKMQAVLDFPFQEAARNYASKGQSAAALGQFFAGDDWYTDADSNVYQLPTFLGNHDMGRIGSFVQADNPGAGDDVWLARDRLAHELMYLSRGNPVIYYGDEQGFTGPGGDQDARQTMFASRVPEYLDDDLIGTAATHGQDNFVSNHPLYAGISGLARLTAQHPTLRDGAHQHRYASDGPGIYAFSRTDQREYVVALNNSTSAQTAAVPTYLSGGKFERVYGTGPSTVTSASDRRLTVTVPALSTVVYASKSRVPASKAAPAVSLAAPAPSVESRGRMQVSANIGGSSFNQVTFYARTGHGGWTSIGTDDNAPYRVFHDVSGLRAGTSVEYKAVVLDNAGHSRTSASRSAKVPPPALTIEAPAEGANVRGQVEVRAVADPERASHVVRFERSVAGGAWTTIGRDSSSPAYTVFDDLSSLNLAAGTQIRYRAVLSDPHVVSAVRTVRYAGPPQAVATVHYFRPAGDYTGWGLHLWGDAVDPAVLAQIAWDKPWPATGVEGGWATYEIPLVDDTKPVNFIMHLPNGDAVPTTREPGGDRAFTPIDNPQIWLKQGDATIYTSAPPTS